MLEHTLGRTGRTVSAIGLGTWQLGADWGDVTEADAFEVLDAAAADGVTFFDTADVYGDGRSESIIGAWRAGNPGVDVTVATKMVRRADVPDAAALTRAIAGATGGRASCSSRLSARSEPSRHCRR